MSYKRLLSTSHQERSETDKVADGLKKGLGAATKRGEIPSEMVLIIFELFEIVFHAEIANRIFNAC